MKIDLRFLGFLAWYFLHEDYPDFSLVCALFLIFPPKISRTRPKVVVIDGIIGAGKTTILDVIKNELSNQGWRVGIIQEPVENWKQGVSKEPSILEKFYADPKRYAYQFQTVAFHDRVKACINGWDRYVGYDIVLAERSVHTDNLFMELLFDEKHIDHTELKNYRDWWNMWTELIPYTPSLYFYLKPSINECMKRIASRNRKGEVDGVTLEYQQSLGKKHDEFYSSGKLQVRDTVVDMITFESDEDFRKNDIERDRVVSTLIKCLDI